MLAGLKVTRRDTCQVFSVWAQRTHRAEFLKWSKRILKAESYVREYMIHLRGIKCTSLFSTICLTYTKSEHWLWSTITSYKLSVVTKVLFTYKIVYFVIVQL